tara:strand:- start:311 stop:940 length:630 start_codon:yes stop_codon:yes gene_type:complete
MGGVNRMNDVQQVTLKVESIQGVNADTGNTQIRAFAPPVTNNYAMTLFLTPEQAEHFDPKFSKGQKDFAATLLKGNLKKDKDGSYPDHYWWNVAVFDGSENDFYMQKLDDHQIAEIEETIDPKTQEVFDEVFTTESQKPKWPEELDAKGQSIVRQVAFKGAIDAGNASGEFVGLRNGELAQTINEMTDVFEQIILGNYTQAAEETKEIS